MAKKILIAFQNDGSLEHVVARKALIGKLVKELKEETDLVNTFTNSTSQSNEDYFFADSSYISVRCVTVLFPDSNKDKYDAIYLTPLLASYRELSDRLMGMLNSNSQYNVYTYSTKRDAQTKMPQLSIKNLKGIDE